MTVAIADGEGLDTQTVFHFLDYSSDPLVVSPLSTTVSLSSSITQRPNFEMINSHSPLSS